MGENPGPRVSGGCSAGGDSIHRLYLYMQIICQFIHMHVYIDLGVERTPVTV